MTGWKGWAALILVLLAGTGSFAAWQHHHHLAAAEEVATARGKAIAAIEAGDHSEAREILHDVMTKVAAPDEKLLQLMASTLEQEGRHREAFEFWTRLDSDFPKHTYQAEVLVARAMDAERASQYADARSLWEEVLRDHPATFAATRARLALFDIEHRSGNTDEARRLGVALVEDASLPPADRRRVQRSVGDINLGQLYGRQPAEGEEIHVIAAGDYVQKLAQKNNVTQELLLRINNISDPKMLSVGHRIRIPKIAFEIVVDKWTNTLTVLANGEFFKAYPCRTGRAEYMTPEGEFTIINKRKDPDWRKPGTGEHIPPGDPANELGTRWMAFQGSSLGIHGTIDPASIGYYTSQGCVGMLKEDVEELFDYIPLGTPLRITGKQNPAIMENSPRSS